MNMESPMPMTTQPNEDITLVVSEDHHQHSSSNDTVIRLASNDYSHYPAPLVTRARVVWFILSHVSFFCALSFFQKTPLYVTIFTRSRNSYLEVVFLCVTTLTHMLFLSGAFLFSPFFDAVLRQYRAHLALKSIGEVGVMILASQLVQRVTLAGGGGERHDQGRRLDENNYYLSSEVASLMTWLLLTVDALAVVNLLRPGYHYSIFEVTVTLTVHLSMELREELPVLSWLVISIVFVIVLIKNFVWHGSTVNNSNVVHG